MLPVLAAVLSTAAAAVVSGAEPTIRWEDAGRHVGQEVVVEGRILGVHCSPTSCLLAFEPTFDRFTAVVQARHFDVFPPEELERRFTGRRVRVRGTVRLLDGKPEIELDDPGDLVLADVAEREAERAVALAESQAEILERLAEVLTGIEALTERLATTQQRLDALLAQLERRAAEPAAVPVPAPGPVLPPAGEPPARGASEVLRSVKRGMSAATVRRLLGDPVAVEPGVAGGEIWHYGYGRSITFDGRARVASLVGFPPR